MIQKVSSENTFGTVGEGIDSLQREGMNKKAMSSFEKTMITTANSLMKKGKTLQQVATAFNMTSEQLKSVMDSQDKGEVKTAACTIAPPSSESETAKATDAYNELHGVTPNNQPAMGRGCQVGSASAIHSAAGGRTDVTDMGGPKQQIKFKTSNSIWDSEVLERQSKEKDNGEILRDRKDAISQKREDIKTASRYTTIDGESLAAALKSTEQRKDANIQSLSVQEHHKYSKQMPQKGISMFDTEEFERVPVKTAAELNKERIAMEQKKRSEDRTWVEDGKKRCTASGINKSFIDQMIDSMKE